MCDTFACQCQGILKVNGSHTKNLLLGVITILRIAEPHKKEFVQAACYNYEFFSSFLTVFVCMLYLMVEQIVAVSTNLERIWRHSV